MEYFLLHDMGHDGIYVEKFVTYEEVWKAYNEIIDREYKLYKNKENRDTRLAIIKGIIVKDNDFFTEEIESHLLKQKIQSTKTKHSKIE